MAKKVGKPMTHRLSIMANVDRGGRVIAAVPLFQPGQPYPMGLSVQRLQGAGAQGVVVRMVGADGNMASMVVVSGKDPATVQHSYLRDVNVPVDPTRPTGEGVATPEQNSASLNRLADAIVEDDDLSEEDRRVQAAADAELDPLPGQGQDGF